MNGMSGLPEGTVTFLFSDIEGSTALLRQLGQERYGVALADYQRLLREASVASHGHEVDTQGDAFFFAFARARDAVEAAAESQRALATHAWPDGSQLRARIGLHTGQASVSDSRYVGLSVHRGARVCAAAAGGQVLLSQATVSIVEDDDLGALRLRSIGRHALKDFDRPVELHQLDVPGLPSKFARPKAKPARRLDRRLALGGVAVAVLIAAAAVLLLARGDEATMTIGPASVGVIDPDSNRVVDEIDLGTKASLIAAGEGFIWLADTDTSTLFKIDPETRQIIRRTAIGAGDIPTGIAVGAGSVWLAVKRKTELLILELAPELGNVRREFVLARGPVGFLEGAVLVFGDGAVWVLDRNQGKVWRIDPQTDVLSPHGEGFDARSIAVGSGSVWLGGNSVVTRLDPATGATLASTPVSASTSYSTSIGVGAGGVWFAASSEVNLVRIATRTSATTDSFVVGAGATGVAVGEDAVWVANSVDGTVLRIGPDRATIVLGAPVHGVVTAYGSIWTSPGEPVR